MKKIILFLSALFLITYGMFGAGLLDLLDKPQPSPKPEPELAILNIDKPSAEVIEKVKNFSAIITDPTDRAKLAIFNYEFANVLISYDTDVQKLNDVYVLAGKKFFKNSLVGKYSTLPEQITNLIKDIIGEENHTLSSEEKNKLNQYFLGVAWVLLQKV
jgi:hypothetical protein